MKLLLTIFAIIALGALLGLGIIHGGFVNIAADDPHSKPVLRLMETARDRSIAARTGDVVVPNLEDPALIRSGAGNYNAMCMGCHLAPGMGETELSLGLYPKPPRLAQLGAPDPARAFWVIKHGIKATGMPAWGASMEDKYVWGLVAFVRKLPKLDAESFNAQIAASGGHQHGGGETIEQKHADEGEAHDDSMAEGGDHPQGDGDAMEQEQSDESQPHGHGEPEPVIDESKPHGHDTQGRSIAPEQPQGDERPAHEDGHEAAGSKADGGAPLSVATVEPVAVVDRFFRALAAGDSTSAQMLLDPNVLIFESGGAERSRAEYASHHLGSDAAFLQSAKHRLLSRTGDALGDMAWVASEARLSSSTGAKPIDIVSTETMVLRKTTDGWRIVHIHWSSREK